MFYFETASTFLEYVPPNFVILSTATEGLAPVNALLCIALNISLTLNVKILTINLGLYCPMHNFTHNNNIILTSRLLEQCMENNKQE